MRTGLNPLWNSFFGDTTLAIAEWTYVSASITANALAKLAAPELPAFFYRLGFDIRCLTILFFRIDLRLLNRFADYNVTPLWITLITDGTLMRQRISLSAACHSYQYDVLAPHYVLAQEHVDGPKIAALHNNSYFTHSAYRVFRQINCEVSETTVIEHETFNVLGLAHKLGMR